MTNRKPQLHSRGVKIVYSAARSDDCTGNTVIFNADKLSPMQSARLNAVLDKLSRFDGVVKTLRSHIEELAAAGPLELSVGDGMNER